MRYFWSRFVIFFLIIEAIAFIFYYHYGSHGIKELHELKKIKYDLQQNIEKKQHENDDIRDQIDAWKHDIFLQEKFAREKLALQKENEIIFFR